MTISWKQLDIHSSFLAVHSAPSQMPLVSHISMAINLGRVHLLTYQFQGMWGMCSRPLHSSSRRNPSASVPRHLWTLVHRWGDNCKGMTAKEIIGDSIPPNRSWTGLGFWSTAQVSVYPASVWGFAANQIGNMEWNSEEDKQWPSQRALESETQEGRDLFAAEGSTLTPSITHLMRRHNAIVLLLWENGKNLDFTVWLTSFLVLLWHLFSFFSAVFLSSCLPDALFSPARQAVVDTITFWLVLITRPSTLVKLM